MSIAKDPYKTLGVSRSASQDEIRLAYRNLAKQHHPDLNPGNAKAEDRFKAIAAANEILSDVEKRGQFDRGEIDGSGQAQARGPSYRDYADGEAGRRYGRAGAGRRPGNFSDIFGSIFGEEDWPDDIAPDRGPDERYSLETDFLSAVNGATRRLTLPDGRSLDVKIPAATAEGQVLRLRGQGGGATKGAPPGDALIEIHIAPHPYFRRDGDDIRLDLPISLSEAVLGGAVEVPTPAGMVSMKIPPNSANGAELRLRGRGVPAHGGQAKGDLYARLTLTLGPPDAALEAFLRGWTPDPPSDPRHKMRSGS